MTDTRALFICDEATVPPDVDAQRWSHRDVIRSSGDTPDINFRAQSLAATVLSVIAGTRATDLVQIASYVYAADQLVSRGTETDVYARRWRRHLTLCIPVADPEYWSRQELQSKLRGVLAFLTEDEWEFHFSTSRSTVRQIPLELHDQELLESPDTVVLLSGGVDSLCTA
ncbi:MAG: hypothetical protein H0V47_16800, partial [Chloroflexia bacterium]|nr:hypothetical protein [Chloroflexia bacterium]